MDLYDSALKFIFMNLVDICLSFCICKQRTNLEREKGGVGLQPFPAFLHVPPTSPNIHLEVIFREQKLHVLA